MLVQIPCVHLLKISFSVVNLPCCVTYSPSQNWSGEGKVCSAAPAGSVAGRDAAGLGTVPLWQWFPSGPSLTRSGLFLQGPYKREVARVLFLSSKFRLVAENVYEANSWASWLLGFLYSSFSTEMVFLFSPVSMPLNVVCHKKEIPWEGNIGRDTCKPVVRAGLRDWGVKWFSLD